MTPRLATAAFALIILSGCAAPVVDREAAGFNPAKFSSDLEDCRGGTVVSFALKTIGNTLWWSATGAVHGVYFGAVAGDADEGAVVGAIVGGAVGMGLGAREFLADQEDTIERCLRKRGYVISGA